MTVHSAVWTVACETDVAQYAEAARAALADLGPDQVDDLTDGLEANLADALADDGRARRGSLFDEFGPPDVYAAELRAAAGLAPAGAQREGRCAPRLGPRGAQSGRSTARRSHGCGPRVGSRASRISSPRCVRRGGSYADGPSPTWSCSSRQSSRTRRSGCRPHSPVGRSWWRPSAPARSGDAADGRPARTCTGC